MKKFFLLAAICAGLSLFADVAISPRWIFFPVSDLTESDLASLTKIPETIKGVKGRAITLDKNGLWNAANESVPASSGVLMQVVTAKNDTVKTWGFGARSKFEIWLNGKRFIDHRIYGNRPFSHADKENFIAGFPLKKGKNLLAAYITIGHPGKISFAFGEVPHRNIEAETPTMEKFKKFAAMTEYPAVDSKERIVMEKILNNAAIDMDQNVFKNFVAQPDMAPEKVKAICEKHPILYFYESSMDKLINNIKTTKVTGKNVALFFLYNTGYVVKTATSCFGIDIDHRRAAELAEYLDFLLITHKHSDHYNLQLMDKMKSLGKPVVSNFYNSAHLTMPPAKLKFKDISISVLKNHQGANIANKGILVNCYLVKCGNQPDACVIYHVGDSSFHQGYPPGCEIDYFICNPRPGGELLIEKMVEKMKPHHSLISHALELRHCKPFFWILAYGNLCGDMTKCRKFSPDTLMPFWGEKFLWQGR